MGGAGASQDAGLGLGLSGTLQLGRERGSTVGIPVRFLYANASPKSGALFVSGIHAGRWVYVEGLAGVVEGVEEIEGYDSGRTIYSGKTTVGAGLGFGVNIELGSRVGLGLDFVVVKGLGTDGFVGGAVAGPIFYPFGSRQ